MRILLFYGNEDTDTDYIIQNYLPLPIFIGKTEKDCTIIITQYIPKFTLFWAENNYLFNSLFSSEITSYYFSKESKIYINNYIKLAQMNIRISSKYLPFNKSNNDTMIYFIGRIPSGVYKKKLIWNKAEEKLLKYQIFLKIVKDL